MTANAGPLLIEVIAALRRGETLRYGFNRGAPRWWLSPRGLGVDPAIAAAAIMQPDIHCAGGNLFAETWGQAWHYRGPIQQNPARMRSGGAEVGGDADHRRTGRTPGKMSSKTWSNDDESYTPTCQWPAGYARRRRNVDVTAGRTGSV